MLESIVSYGLAVGAVYALIGITYNVMFTASRVFSFTAGMLGMLGGVLGALFITKLGLPAIVGFVLVLACGAADRRRHRDRGRAAGAEEPRAASLRAVDPGLRPDGAAVRRHRMGHRRAALSAPDPDRPGLARPAVLAAAAGLRRHHRGPRTALSPHADRSRLPGDRRGQLCRARPGTARAAAAHGELRPGRRDRRAWRASPAPRCCWLSSATSRS